MQISAIVPTFNRADTLRSCIESLLHQTLDPQFYEIVIVDNNSNDTTRDTVQAYLGQGHNVRYVFEPRQGLHFARHAGAKAAKAEIVAYTDDDAIVDSRWLEELVKAYKYHDIGCAGGKITVQWDMKPPDWLLPYECYYGNIDYGTRCRVLSPHEHVFGANISLRREALFEVGGFHPDFIGSQRVGSGEIGLCVELHKRGIKIAWVPTAQVRHLQTVNLNGNLKYLKKHFANQGVVGAHLQLLNEVPSRYRFAARSLVALARYCEYKALATFFKVKDCHVKLDHELKSSYFLSRSNYELQLAYNKNVRALALSSNRIE